MVRVLGNADVAALECINPRKDYWKVRWDFQTDEDGATTYMEEDFDHQPTQSEILQTIVSWTNAQTDAKILSGFVWNDINVWLSTENQYYFKAAYDLAVQTGGSILPVTFKLGEDENGAAVYHTFETLEDITDFYTKAFAYINTCLTDGWTAKDTIAMTAYVQEDE